MLHKGGNQYRSGMIIPRWIALALGMMMAAGIFYFTQLSENESTGLIKLEYFLYILSPFLSVLLLANFNSEIRFDKNTGFLKIRERKGMFGKVVDRIYGVDEIKYARVKYENQIEYSSQQGRTKTVIVYEARIEMRDGFYYLIKNCKSQGSALQHANHYAQILGVNVLEM